MVIMSVAKNTKYVPVEESTADAEDDSAPISKEILVIAQEVKIVQMLACNDVNKRNRQMRKLAKWLQLRARSSFPFKEEDFMRIWKGLYYNMWMSDKPLVQEELAEKLGRLLDCFGGDVELSVTFFGAFLRTMCTHWFGIDQWRLDKFMMLVRRMLRAMLRVLRANAWATEGVRRFGEQMTQTVLSVSNAASGLTMHFLDIFLEELAKVSDGKISAEQVAEFTRPFIVFLNTQRDFKLVTHCRTRIFYHLIYQSSLGREYTEKYNAWRKMGFPTRSIHGLEKDDDGVESLPEEEDAPADEPESGKGAEKHLDPRAGNVDVLMPELPVDAKQVIDELEPLIYKGEASTKTRKMLKRLLDNYKTYQRGVFPLGVKTMPRFESKSVQPLISDKIGQLDNLENEMYGLGRKLKQMSKRKRRRLLNSLNYDNVDESSFEQFINKAIPKEYLQERKKKQKQKTAIAGGWHEEEIEQSATLPKKKSKKRALLNGTDAAAAKPATPAKKKKKKRVAVDASPASDEPVKKTKKRSQQNAAIASETVTAAEVGEMTSEAPEESAKPMFTPATNEWDTPLGENEVEYFITPRKMKIKHSNMKLVRNPLVRRSDTDLVLSTPQAAVGEAAVSATSSPQTPASVKRVKIALNHNTMQNASEYIKQIRSSPNVPYDAAKKPGKGLLKPNSVPSPINPFYKKKIGLRLLNDTM